MSLEWKMTQINETSIETIMVILSGLNNSTIDLLQLKEITDAPSHQLLI